MAISPQRLTIYLYSAHRAVILLVIVIVNYIDTASCWFVSVPRRTNMVKLLYLLTPSSDVARPLPLLPSATPTPPPSCYTACSHSQWIISNEIVCSFLLSDFLLSVAAPSLSRTLPRHRRCSQFSRDWKCTHFVTRTGDYHTNCFSPIFTLVLVAVVCCLDHVKQFDWLNDKFSISRRGPSTHCRLRHISCLVTDNM